MKIGVGYKIMVNYLKMYMCVDNFYLYFIFWKKILKIIKLWFKFIFIYLEEK